jgi:hypothetical protein
MRLNLITALGVAVAAATLAHSADLRLGIVGTDTSHATNFTRILNDHSAKDHIGGAVVVAAFKGGSPEIANSRDRIERFTDEMTQKRGVALVTHISDLCGKVDGIMILSVDGRAHLNEFRQSLQCGVPIFVDKPLAATLADVREIARLAAEAYVPWFSSSAMRFTEIQSLRVPRITGAFVWGPGPLEEHHQLDLSWYAIHSIEMMFVVMGTGAVEATRTYATDGDVITGRWQDGRTATVRALRPYGKYGAVVFLPGNESKMISDVEASYGPVISEIVRFMTTKQPAVPNQETLEIFSFLDAAQRSREQGGRPVRLR